MDRKSPDRRGLGKAVAKFLPPVVAVGETEEAGMNGAAGSGFAGQPAIQIEVIGAPAFDQAARGRRSRNGVAFSKASAMRSTVASWNGLPTSWIATGSPPAPKPEHTDIAG